MGSSANSTPSQSVSNSSSRTYQERSRNGSSRMRSCTRMAATLNARKKCCRRHVMGPFSIPKRPLIRPKTYSTTARYLRSTLENTRRQRASPPEPCICLSMYGMRMRSQPLYPQSPSRNSSSPKYSPPPSVAHAWPRRDMRHTWMSLLEPAKGPSTSMMFPKWSQISWTLIVTVPCFPLWWAERVGA